MTLETGVKALAEAVGDDVKSLNLKIGDLNLLPTLTKNNLVNAFNELITAFSDGFGQVFELMAQIDDAAGSGDTDVTWSADKSSRELGELSELIGDVESMLVAINGEP